MVGCFIYACRKLQCVIEEKGVVKFVRIVANSNLVTAVCVYV